MNRVPTDEEVLGQADGIAAEMLELCDLIDGKRFLDRATKADAQERLRRIKSRLDEVCRAGQAIEREREMTSVERDFYWAVRKARTQIRVRWNSHPLSSPWCDQLYSARGDLTYFLSQTRAPRQERIHT